MGQASGVFKQVTYKVETTYGVAPAAAAAQALRRVTSSLDLTKDTYQSAEMRPDFQMADFRHGLRKTGGTINGELSAKTYADFMAAVMKKDFVAGVTVTNASITIGGAAGAWTIQRAAGSWLADGVKVGDVVRLTAGAFDAANMNKNIQATAVTANTITGIVLNASPLVTQGPIASATLTVVGKKAFTPQSGHTDKSFALEHWFPEVPRSELFVGSKVSKVTITLPATGMATIAIEFAGKNRTKGAAQYFTNPTPVTVTGTMAAVNGVVKVGPASNGTITSATIEITAAQSSEPGIGSNTADQASTGRVIVTGQITAKFDSAGLDDLFDDEVETSAYLAFTADNTPASDFLAFGIGRLKLNGASKDDGEKILIQTLPFQALLDINGGAGKATDLTTLTIQDSAA